MLRWCVIALCALAGAAHADETALRAEYRIDGPQGARELVLVRSADTIEYRQPGEPIRRWRRVADGIEHQQLFPDARRMVTFSPGDLRALGQAMDWTRLASLIAPTLRTHLAPDRSQRAFEQPAQRYRGDLDGIATELLWLEHDDLPARYRRGRGRSAETLELLHLERMPAATAFTASADLREIDYADIGDMERDAFARRFIEQGAVALPHGH